MKFAINLDTLRIHGTVGSPVPLAAVEMILGSAEPVEITAFRGTTPEILDTPLQLGIKAAGDYAGDFLAYLSTWTQTGDTFEGVLNLNTVEAGALLGTAASADILLEIAFGYPERTAFAIAGKLKNDLIKGTEGVPTDGTPAYPQPAQIPILRLDITGAAGGTSSDLDSILTDPINLATYPLLYLAKTGTSGALQGWQLMAGTDAENVAAGIVRPDDYATTTNEKVWKQIF